MNLTANRGYTLIEMIFAIFIGGLLLMALASLVTTIEHVGSGTRAEADDGALEWSAERVLLGAVEGAGKGMPAAPNFAGVGATTATLPSGMPADTLVVVQGDGEALRVAARPCRAAQPGCVVLVGDQTRSLRPGDVIVVGTRALGLVALQVLDAPASFYAPCAGDCPERVVCATAAGPVQSFVHITGSLRQPGGSASPEPCAQAYFADGSRCEEVAQPVAAAIQRPSCRSAGPSSPFTEVKTADRTATLGFPSPAAVLTRSGSSASPAVVALRVRASRFWVQAGARDSVLVRQNGLTSAGEWRTPVGIATPVSGLEVETRQRGAWVRGIGVRPQDLIHSTSNPNYVTNPLPDGTGKRAGWSFLTGYHTIGAVRLRYFYRGQTASNGLPRTVERRLILAVPQLHGGGTGDSH